MTTLYSRNPNEKPHHISRLHYIYFENIYPLSLITANAHLFIWIASASSISDFENISCPKMGYKISILLGLLCLQVSHFSGLFNFILKDIVIVKNASIRNNAPIVENQETILLKSTCDVNLLSKLSIIFKEWRVMNNVDRGGVIVLFVL